MSKPNRKALQKMVSIFPAHVLMIERLITVKGIASASEVFRQALTFFYDEKFKDYVDTPKKREMEEEILKKVQEDLVSNEDFATQTLKGKIITDPLGQEFVLIHQQGNWINHIPLPVIKSWYEKHPMDVAYHLDKLKEKPIESAFSNYLKETFEREYGIVLE